jgi:esterase/lipase
MKKYQYLKVSKTKKLRYMVNYFKKNLYIIFLPGFASDIEGKKAKIFKKYAIKNKLGFLAMEYSGHGKSSGEFKKGNISVWSNDAKICIKKIVKKNNFIIIGSSMGAWLSLILFKNFKKQIKGFMGIGSAPEFTTRLMWKKFSKRIKNKIIEKGESIVKNGPYEYPITYQLIKDGEKNKNKVLKKKINTKINVMMIHGSKDKSVPVEFSKKILKLFPNSNKKLKIIKNGNHSLSSKKNLKILLKKLNLIISNII